MEGTSSSCFPANYVTLKDLQERWIKRKQDEENEEKLRRLRAEEETKKAQNEAEAKNHQPKSKNRRRSAKKYHSSPTAPASHSQEPKKSEGGERKQRNLAIEGKANNGFIANEGKVKKANEFNANEGKAEKMLDAKSETLTAIAGRRRSKKRQSARSRIPVSESDSMVEIAGKIKEKERKGFQIAWEDRTEEICCKVADLSIPSGGNQRGGRISRGGDDRRRRAGGTVRASAPAAGMVWVRKTTEG